MLGVDYGSKRFGVAVTDSDESMALPVGSFSVKSENAAVETVCRLAFDREVREIVLGVPVDHEGGETKMSGLVRAFAAKLRAKLPEMTVTLASERYSTKLAEAPMKEAGMSELKRRGRVDAGAATVMLMSVIETRRPREK